MKKLYLFFAMTTLVTGCVGVVEDPHHHHYHHDRVVVEERPAVVEVR